MFNLVGNMLKTAVDTALLPVAVVKDVVTVGGLSTDDDPATIRQMQRILEDVEDTFDDL